jgi:hypothetical protein
MGIPATNPHLREYFQKTNFFLEEGSSAIINRQPQPGEAGRFHVISQSSRRSTRPGLIALLPGKSPGANILLMAGDSAPLFSFLITISGLDLIVEGMKELRPSPHFEAVVQMDVDNGILLKYKVVAFRPFIASP